MGGGERLLSVARQINEGAAIDQIDFHNPLNCQGLFTADLFDRGQAAPHRAS
jgi:hypothetical protein